MNINIKQRNTPRQRSYQRWGSRRILFVLCACLIFWFGFISGLFACHHGFGLKIEFTAHHPLPAEVSTPKTESINAIMNATTTVDADVQDDKPNQPPDVIPLKPDELKLPTPIIVMGLMKAGTTSIYGYFKCGLDPKHSKLSHYNCNAKKKGSVMSCGKRMRRNIQKYKKPAFDSIDMFTLYAELDGQEKNGGITVPQYHFLDEIHDHFPNATWILNLRNPQDWLRSIDRWQDLRQRFIDNPFWPDLPKGTGADDKDMIFFYNQQAQRIRNFVKEHPSHHLVEVAIDQPNAGQIMEDAFGISDEACWRKRNVNNNGEAVWTEH